MGQKVHPEAMRVGYIHDWKSNWFSERNFSDFLIEDVRIRDHITNKLAHAGLSDITIRKDAAEVEVNIHTARPGIVIGKLCRATVGVVGNSDHQNVTIGKAGRKRHLGVRPQTRGKAMNPVDHPHGGGEGGGSLGNHPQTPWGVPTIGYRTRKKGKQSDRYIVRGRRRGKKGGR